MKKIVSLLLILILLLPACTAKQPAQIVATTLLIYDFTVSLCEGTNISVSLLITENVSCLHDYTLKPNQMQAIEQAQLVIINGAGLEDFMEDAIHDAGTIVNASANISLHEGAEHDEHHAHSHEDDPHIWLSPQNAKQMVGTICEALTKSYPEFNDQFKDNKSKLLSDLDSLQAYGESKLANVSCRKLITFHDGFHYLAESFDLNILRAVEEESGAEASATELIELISLVTSEALPAIFTETNGSVSAANIIHQETGVKVYTLDMAMSGNGYFDSMYHNIDTLWEALK